MRRNWLLIGIGLFIAIFAFAAVACDDDDDNGDNGDSNGGAPTEMSSAEIAAIVILAKSTVLFPVDPPLTNEVSSMNNVICGGVLSKGALLLLPPIRIKISYIRPYILLPASDLNETNRIDHILYHIPH